MAETEETPQIDEIRLQAIRRRIEEVVGDAPQLAKLRQTFELDFF